MNTQEAAKLLTSLAAALKSSPYETLEELAEGHYRKVDERSIDVPGALSMLVALSSFDKFQWLQVINEYDFPIEVRRRDGSRDVMGKLLKYLEANTSAREKLSRISKEKRSQTSPELNQALEFLLRK